MSNQKGELLDDRIHRELVLMARSIEMFRSSSDLYGNDPAAAELTLLHEQIVCILFMERLGFDVAGQQVPFNSMLQAINYSKSEVWRESTIDPPVLSMLRTCSDVCGMESPIQCDDYDGDAAERLVCSLYSGVDWCSFVKIADSFQMSGQRQQFQIVAALEYVPRKHIDDAIDYANCSSIKYGYDGEISERNMFVQSILRARKSTINVWSNYRK